MSFLGFMDIFSSGITPMSTPFLEIHWNTLLGTLTFDASAKLFMNHQILWNPFPSDEAKPWTWHILKLNVPVGKSMCVLEDVVL